MKAAASSPPGLALEDGASTPTAPAAASECGAAKIRAPRWVLACAGGLVAAFAIRAGLVRALPLHPYEAYQWVCSSHLALGYFDGPPLLTWVVRALCAVAGDGLPALRLLPLLSGISTAALLVTLGRSLFGDLRVGILAALLYVVTPVHALRGLLLFDEGALQPLLWLATVYAYHRALGTGRWAWWMGAGVLLGVGLLNRWAMALLPVCLLLFLDLSGPGRRLLRGPRLWLSLAVAALISLPVLISGGCREHVLFIGLWERLFGDSGHPGASDLLQVLDQQLPALGPGVVFLHTLGVLYALWAFAHRADDRYLFCLAFWVPALAFFLGLSLGFHVSTQSLEFGYLIGHVAAGAALLQMARHLADAEARRKAAAGLAALLGANALLAAAAQAPPLIAALPTRPAYLAGFWDACSGWEELAAHVSRLVAQSSGRLAVASPDYRVCCAVSYRTGGRIRPLCLYDTGRGVQLQTWESAAPLHGRDVLLVAPEDGTPKRYYHWLRAAFPRLTALPSLTAGRRRMTRMFALDRGERFRAGTVARW